MKKMVICAALLAVCTQGIKADEYNYLTVAYNNIEQSITLSKVQKITFSASEVIVATTEGNVTFPLNQMEKMTFTAEPTAIEKLPETTCASRTDACRRVTAYCAYTTLAEHSSTSPT